MPRPRSPCTRCGGPRLAGQRVSVDGRKIPACKPCAQTPWTAKTSADPRRGRGIAYRRRGA